MQVAWATGWVEAVAVYWGRAVRRESKGWGAAPQHRRMGHRWRKGWLGRAEHVVDVAEGEVVGEVEEDEVVEPTSSFRRRWGGCGRSARQRQQEGGRREP